MPDTYVVGRSEGAEVQFRVDELGEDVAVFTTRPDTLFGATLFVLARVRRLYSRRAHRTIEVERSLGEAEIVALATASPRVRAHVEGVEIRRTIVVPGRLLNLVTARG